MEKLILLLFTSYPISQKDKFIHKNNKKNYFRMVFLSKIMIGVSVLMYLVSIFENDLRVIRNFNIAFVISSIIIFLTFLIIKPTEKGINNYHNSLVIIMILTVLLWSSSLIAFVPGRYEIFGTYSLIILSIASVVYLKWTTQLLLQIASLVYIFTVYIFMGDFFLSTPVIPKITVILFLNIFAWGISRLLYYNNLQNYELDIELNNQNTIIQSEVDKKTKALSENLLEIRKAYIETEKSKMLNIELKEDLELLTNSTLEGIYGVDMNENCTFVNKSFLEILGFDNEEEILGKNMHDLIHSSYEYVSSRPSEKCPLSESLFKGKHVRLDGILWGKDRKRIPVAYSSTPQIRNGEVIGAVCTFKDITERKQAMESLKYERNIAQMYLDVAGVILLALDRNGNITLLNKRGCQILGLEEEQVLGVNWFDNFIPDNISDEMKDGFKNIITNKGEFPPNYENLIISSSGEERIVCWNNTVLYGRDSEIIGILSSGEDVTDLKQRELELKYAANNDYLTGIYNRRYYEENLEKLDIEENYPLTIAMADINGLKLINDAFGYESGDDLLISAAKVITESCREGDLIARIGGDEFVIVMPKTSEEEAEKIIENINIKSALYNVESIKLSISFGYKSKIQSSEDIQEIFRTAEDLMYRKKLLEIPSMRSGAIETILNTLYEKDKNSEIHSRSVSNISERLAKANGMNRQDIAEVKTAGLLHDIGKIIISERILKKEGKLTVEEYDIMKTHPEIGFRILNSTSEMRSISNIVLNHHERCDGKGYPRGIKLDKIPLKSRVISIADAFDAMTSERTYRDIVSNEEALKEIIDNAGTQFDPELVDVFKENFEEIVKET